MATRGGLPLLARASWACRDGAIRQTHLYPPPSFPPRRAMVDQYTADQYTVHVGDLDVGCTREDVLNHFRGCGAVTRATVLKDHATGQPKARAHQLIIRGLAG
jgi:hypothetical protein